MGFLGKFTRIVQKISGESAEHMAKQIVNNISGEKIFTEEENNEDKKVKNKVGTIDFQPIQLPDSRTVNNHFYDIDENDNQVAFKQTFMIHNDYKQYDSGASEIDISFIYGPGNDFDNEPEYDDNKLTIAIGILDQSYHVIKKYEETSELPDNVELYKLTNCRAIYKTITKNENWHNTIIEYHFLRGNDKSLYNQIYLTIPEKLVGSGLAKEGEKVLEQVVSTYKEEADTKDIMI